MFMPRVRLSKNGFTLIELLVVISIIGVLAAVLLVNFVGVRERAADAAKKNNLRQLKTALRLYYNDYQVYPGASGTLIAGCGANHVTACQIGEPFAVGTTVYTSEVPADAAYYAPAGGAAFLLVTPLDNASDADIQASQTRCNVGSRAYAPTLGETDYVACED